MANFRNHVRAEHVDDTRVFENPAEFLRRAMIPNVGIQEDFLEESSTRVFSKDVARHLLFFEALQGFLAVLVEGVIAASSAGSRVGVEPWDVVAPGKKLRKAPKRSDGRLRDPQLERTFREPYANNKNAVRLVNLSCRRASRRRGVRGPAGARAGRVEESTRAAAVFIPVHGSSAPVHPASMIVPSRRGDIGCRADSACGQLRMLQA